MSNNFGKKTKSSSSNTGYSSQKRKKNIIPGTAKFERRDIGSYEQVGHGKNYANVWPTEDGKKPRPTKSGTKGKGDPIHLPILFENVSKDIWPNAHPKRPVMGNWKRH